MLEAEIAKYLDGQNVLSFDETGTSGNTFIDVLPATPDEAIALYSQGGVSPSPKFIEDVRDIQFLVRGGQDPRPPKSTAEDIYDNLEGITHLTTNDGTQIIAINSMQSGPTHTGRDDNGRHMFSLNFSIEFENTSSKHRSEK